MNMFIDLLRSDNYIITNKTLIKKLGLHEAIIIGELCSEYAFWEKQGKLDEEGFFYSTRENIEENTGLSEHLQRKALESLKQYGIIQIVKKGIPAVNCYKIHFDKLSMVLTSRPPQFQGQELNTMDLNNTCNTVNSITTNKEIENKEKVISENFLRSANSLTNTSKQKEIDKFVELYKEHCKGLSQPRVITDIRKKKIYALIRKYGWDTIIECFDKAQQSDFLKGKVPSSDWKADLDFFLREDKFLNILEGRYGGTKEKRGADGLVIAPRATKEERENEYIYKF